MQINASPLNLHLYLFLIGFLFLTIMGQGQVLFSPEENSATLFCKPGVDRQSRGKGVMFRYGNRAGYNWNIATSKQQVEVQGVERLQAKIKIPLINQVGLKALIGYEFDSRRFHLNLPANGTISNIIRQLNTRALKNNRLSAYVTKSFDAKNYLALIARATFRGNYEPMITFRKGYRTYNFTAMWGIKPRPDLEWGIGLRYTNRFFRDSDQILPFVVYNQTFSKKWGIESTLPAQVYIRHNFSPTHLILMGFNIQSLAFGLNGESQEATPPDSAFREFSLNLGPSFEQKLFSWFWLKIDCGYNFPLRSEFIPIEQDFVEFKQRSGGSPYFLLGIFISPPKELIK